MLLVDASVYIFRAWHSLPDSMLGPDGFPVNTAYGFADFLARLLASEQPTLAAVAFDESLELSFRNRIYPAYKANREPAPPELEAQIAACRQLVAHLGIVGVASSHFEADDLIGTLAARAQTAELPVTIVSADKDLAQLLTKRDTLWDYARNRVYDAAAIRDKFGVNCNQIADYLALAGDPVDNIPGVPGVGAKSAAAVLQEFGDLDSVYANLERVSGMAVRGAARLAEHLRRGREDALLSRRLTGIVTDAALPASADCLECRASNPQALAAWCDGLGIGERLRQRLLPGGRA